MGVDCHHSLGLEGNAQLIIVACLGIRTVPQ